MAQEEGREVALFLKILGVGREVKKWLTTAWINAGQLDALQLA